MPEVGKTYLGKVMRLAEFGAFVEIFPGTEGCCTYREIAENRVKEVRDELQEGDQILVKVLALEGNRIKLTRKAVLREQREKLGLPEPGQIGSDGAGIDASAGGRKEISPAMMLGDEDGNDFDDDGEESSDEPNFNRADGVPAVTAGAGGQRPSGAGGERRPGGRRRRGGRRPGCRSGRIAGWRQSLGFEQGSTTQRPRICAASVSLWVRTNSMSCLVPRPGVVCPSVALLPGMRFGSGFSSAENRQWGVVFARGCK